jgi:hydroxymethylbilane synthase
LRSLRQDVEVVGLRGNVETRLARALGPDADLDAVVLAQAGLIRVGRADTVSEVFDVQRMVPAAGQGALAIEVRAQDAGTYQAAASLADRDATLAVSAERAVLGALGAGCAAPIGVFGQVIEAELVLFAAVASLDGRENALASQRVILGSSPENHLAVDLGRRVARALLAQGAAGLATLAPDGGLLAEDAAP